LVRRSFGDADESLEVVDAAMRVLCSGFIADAAIDRVTFGPTPLVVVARS